MEPEISIILPCRNEEEAIGYCLDKIKEVVEKNNLDAEVIISDLNTKQLDEIYNKCVSDIDTEEEQYDDQINRAL